MAKKPCASKRTLEQFSRLPRYARDAVYVIARKSNGRAQLGATELWAAYDAWTAQSIEMSTPWHGGHRGPVLED